MTISTKEKVAALEKAVFAKVDLVIANGKLLAQKAKLRHKNVLNSPSGVDFDSFQKAVKLNTIFPDIARIPQPRIGYAGILNSKVDFDLLFSLASMHPEWSIILIGPKKISAGRDLDIIGKLEIFRTLFIIVS